MLKPNDIAPDFELQADDGSTVRLSDLRGRKVVLYFYPKDDTPGCTIEACEFRDRSKDLAANGAVVLGVSPDTVESHRRFKEKYGLDFPLLADTDHRVAEAYGVWQQKTMYGRTYWGVARTTFLIDEEGRIARVFENVKPAGHAAEVLEALG
ncbi:MAG: thioredoxin-dependent thiol peroxidase [bacterium]|jgi:peroxiredoxin Q/BCP|nr:MAG: thioredoxin-dependent thiol peroxidase [bacterium]